LSLYLLELYVTIV